MGLLKREAMIISAKICNDHTNIHCILCGSNKYVTSSLGKDFFLFKCLQCGLCCSNALFSEDIGALYTKDYYLSWGMVDADESSARIIKAITFEKRLLQIERYLQTGKILDVGCATGFFLEVAKKRGWQPFGVEVNEYAAGIAGKRFGNAITCDSFEKANYGSAYFDAVIMCDLLEHLRDPLTSLIKANKILKLGGILSITSPNIESLTSKLCWKFWPHYKKEHLYYFSPATIKQMLQLAGCDIIEIRPAVKALNLEYLREQFNVYNKYLPSTRIFSLFSRLLPIRLRRKPFLVCIGEMTIIAKKTKELNED